MGIFPDNVVEPLVTIHPWSLESIGPNLHTQATGLLTGAVSAVYPTANLALYVPFSVMKPITVTLLWWYNGAAVNGNVDCGIYDISGTRIISTGSTVQAVVSSIQSVDIADIQIGPGNFYLAIALDNIVGTLFRGTLYMNIGPAVTGMAQEANAFPLPATATFAQITGNYIPVFGLTTRTLI